MRYRLLIAWTAGLAACSFQHGAASQQVTGDGGGGGGTIDGRQPDAPDAAVPPGDGEICLGDATFAGGVFCFSSAPTTTFAVSSTQQIDTGNGISDLADCTFKRAQPGNGRPLCVIAAGTISISGTLVATGTDPLVLVATGSFTISSSGKIDVSSSVSSGPRAGADDPGCDSSSRGDDDSNGAGGGAGGSLGAQGGDGGTGDGNAVAGGSAGNAVAGPPAILVGGCSGGQGGDGGGGRTGGGDGGGAVYLVAGGTLMIDGAIDASGAGGHAANAPRGGGGGGGSGGMIALWAQDLTTGGPFQVFANGGGGASGATGVTDGGAGKDPTVAGLAAGGGRLSGAGDGGAGAVAGAGAQGGGMGQSNGANSSGGGGGGGGVGVIRVLSGQALTGPGVSPVAGS